MREIFLDDLKRDCTSSRAVLIKKQVSDIVRTNNECAAKRTRPKNDKEIKILESFARK